MKIYAYIRFSSDNQRDNSSIEVQRFAIHQYVKSAAEFAGGELVERIDEAKSATTLKNRTALESIIKESARGDAVVVFKLDRLGRNLLDGLQVLKQLEDRGVHVFSTSEPTIPLVRHILLAVAEDFSRVLGDRLRLSLRNLAASGYVANKPPFGYKRVGPRARGKLEPVPEKAAVVRQIFQLRASGHSLRDITRLLNANGVPSPKGRGWIMSCVRALLRNETYIGTITCGDRIFKKGHGLVGRRPRSEWSVCENAHEPIIEMRLWQSVRDLDSTQKVGHAPTRRHRTEYPWTGFLKCAECGANLVRHRVKRVDYYGCQSGRNRGSKLPCNRQYLVRADVVAEVIPKVLLERVYAPDVNKMLLEIIRVEHERVRGDSGHQLFQVQRKRDQKSRDIEIAQRRLARVSDDDFEVLLKEIQKMKAELESLDAQIESLKKARPGTKLDFNEIKQKFEENLKQLEAAFKDADVGKVREALRHHIEKIDVWPDKRARLYRSPDSLKALIGSDAEHIPTGI